MTTKVETGRPRRPSNQKQARRGLSGYAKGMLAFVAVLLVVIVIVWLALWNILKAYEKTTPRAALDAYFASLAAGEYGTILAESDFQPNELNAEEDYIALLHTLFGQHPENLTYRPAQAKPGTEGKVYAVFAGEAELGKVLLIQTDKAKYGWIVRAYYDYMTPYTVTAPGYVQVLINGVALPPDAPDAVHTPIDTFKDLPDPGQIPYTVTYQTQPTLALPEFTATSATGLPCEVSVDNDSHQVSVRVVLPEETAAEYSAVMETTVKAYANFVSQDASFGALSAHLYPGTTLYQNMANFYNGWYVDHESFNFRDMSITNLTATSADTFTGDITFVYEIYQQGTLHEFPSNYHMSFARSGDSWLLLDIQTK